MALEQILGIANPYTQASVQPLKEQSAGAKVAFGGLTTGPKQVPTQGFETAVSSNPIFNAQPKVDGTGYETASQNYACGLGGSCQNAETTHNGKDGVLGANFYTVG